MDRKEVAAVAGGCPEHIAQAEVAQDGFNRNARFGF
jgi:hypothetical protein